MISTLAATLDEKKLQEIRRLEQELGTPLLAFVPLDVQPAVVDERKLEKIRQLEQSLGVSLVAVQKRPAR